MNDEKMETGFEACLFDLCVDSLGVSAVLYGLLVDE